MNPGEAGYRVGVSQQMMRCTHGTSVLLWNRFAWETICGQNENKTRLRDSMVNFIKHIQHQTSNFKKWVTYTCFHWPSLYWACAHKLCKVWVYQRILFFTRDKNLFPPWQSSMGELKGNGVDFFSRLTLAMVGSLGFTVFPPAFSGTTRQHVERCSPEKRNLGFTEGASIQRKGQGGKQVIPMSCRRCCTSTWYPRGIKQAYLTLGTQSGHEPLRHESHLASGGKRSGTS